MKSNTTACTGLAWQNGKLYVANTNANEVVEYDAKKGTILRRVPVPKPMGIAAAGNDTQHVVSDGKVVTLDGKQVIADHLDSPRGIAVAPDNRRCDAIKNPVKLAVVIGDAVPADRRERQLKSRPIGDRRGGVALQAHGGDQGLAPRRRLECQQGLAERGAVERLEDTHPVLHDDRTARADILEQERAVLGQYAEMAALIGAGH